jgi:hypothetical protein
MILYVMLTVVGCRGGAHSTLTCYLCTGGLCWYFIRVFPWAVEYDLKLLYMCTGAAALLHWCCCFAAVLMMHWCCCFAAVLMMHWCCYFATTAALLNMCVCALLLLLCCICVYVNCWNMWIAGICVYVNCCRLFLNELPVSSEVSIHFRFGWEMGTPRSKK